MTDEGPRLEAETHPVKTVIFKEAEGADAWLHPSQSDYCRVARETSGGELFDQRQALIDGVAMTLLTLLGLAIAIPYWRMLGLLRP